MIACHLDVEHVLAGNTKWKIARSFQDNDLKGQGSNMCIPNTTTREEQRHCDGSRQLPKSKKSIRRNVFKENEECKKDAWWVVACSKQHSKYVYVWATQLSQLELWLSLQHTKENIDLRRPSKHLEMLDKHGLGLQKPRKKPAISDNQALMPKVRMGLQLEMLTRVILPLRRPRQPGRMPLQLHHV